jgi:hypothetical protein
MNWDRKGVMLMLAVVVIWTAMPASACLLASHPMEQRDCCRAMANACESPAMGADSSCCQVHGSVPALVSVQAYSQAQSQEAAALPSQVGAELPAVSGRTSMTAFEAPPPKFPPGGAFALRI